MKLPKLILVLLFVFLNILVIFYSTISIAAFSTSDLEGTWYGHSLISGNSGAWNYFNITIDNQGGASIQITNSDDSTESDSATVSINDNGIVSIADSPSSHGIMSSDKNIIAMTMTEDVGAYSLMIWVKGGGSFSQSDLTGTWYGHTLTSGNEEVWEYDTTTIDSEGSVSVEVTDVYDNTEMLSNVARLDITSEGVLSDVLLGGSDKFHGVMNFDKDIMVFTDTRDGEETYSLTVLAKGGGSFDQSDLEGTYLGHTLASGSREFWEYDTTLVNSQGVISMHTTNSDGNTESNSDVATFNITSNGILSVVENASIHGVMSLDVNMAVLTETLDEGIYALSILIQGTVELPIAEFSATPLTGSRPLEVTFSDTSLGGVTGWLWDFGDGTTSTQQNPTHTYSRIGTYTVSLTVNGTEGSDMRTKTDYIIVKPGAMPWLPILLDE